MAQVVLDCFNVVSATDRGDSVGVAQIVETGIRTTDGRCSTLEVPINDGVVQVVAKVVCKDKIEKAYNKVDICFCQKEENGYGVQVYKRRNHARAVIS